MVLLIIQISEAALLEWPIKYLVTYDTEKRRINGSYSLPRMRLPIYIRPLVRSVAAYWGIIRHVQSEAPEILDVCGE